MLLYSTIDSDLVGAQKKLCLVDEHPRVYNWPILKDYLWGLSIIAMSLFDEWEILENEIP
jgi:hypothetical protein